MTTGQKKALEKLWPEFGIVVSEPLLPDRIFNRSAPRVLDIGCGMGETTLALARQFPHYDFISVEVHRPGIGNLLNLIQKNSITNIRVANCDVMDLLSSDAFHHAFDKVLIYFPDPWPKKRHQKRRLINDRFLERLIPAMKPQARIYLATDWEDYALHMIATLDPFAGLNNLAGNARFSPRPRWRPQTKFETRGERLGHQVFDLVYAVNRCASPRQTDR